MRIKFFFKYVFASFVEFNNKHTVLSYFRVSFDGVSQVAFNLGAILVCLTSHLQSNQTNTVRGTRHQLKNNSLKLYLADLTPALGSWSRRMTVCLAGR